MLDNKHKNSNIVQTVPASLMLYSVKKRDYPLLLIIILLLLLEP